MKTSTNSRSAIRVAFALWIAALTVVPASACTIFMLTDGDQVLFCNNEDWSDPQTRIWFIPGEDGRHGCAFVGFGNGWGQGGVNAAGLAFDWVAGFKESWERDPVLKEVRGNPAQRMLETCATVEEAIRFFETHWEPSFSYARIFLADRTGASAGIRAMDGRLNVKRSKQSCAMGYRGAVAQELLDKEPSPSPTNAIHILRASKQEGQYATKYSNVFNLKTGEILVYVPPNWNEPVRLDLQAELEKGGHYYDLPLIREQQGQKLRRLTRDMKKF
ncbi:MAG: hypothetical protein KF833_17140 [Verrucomicrobiae bacterium]|nr:hypothetical protein [Verrucomicrobiae bacterium]